jgi:hypothetical protein
VPPSRNSTTAPSVFTASNEPLHEIGAPQPKFSSVQMAPPQRRDS